MELARQEKIWLLVDVCLHTIGSLRFLFFSFRLSLLPTRARELFFFSFLF
jgi:hypothetical protein